MKLRLIKFFKDFLLFTGILRVLSPFNNLFLFIRNFNELKKWINKNNDSLLINDYYAFKRDYKKRINLFKTITEHYRLDQKDILYLEFGVASGESFFWWLQNNSNKDSTFFGFDTFEGLPEDWGGYKKGEMSFAASDVKSKDVRAEFVKGTFQETLHGFVQHHEILLSNKQKLIHLDADLFSSTIFVLSQLYPFLKKGDIILFDEFNVANHEFFAYKIFTESFYVKMKLIGAQNNFYQTAFIVE
jgi:O-methyltransferase